jgi:hypothetical protein
MFWPYLRKIMIVAFSLGRALYRKQAVLEEREKRVADLRLAA